MCVCVCINICINLAETDSILEIKQQQQMSLSLSLHRVYFRHSNQAVIKLLLLTARHLDSECHFPRMH